LKGIVLAGGLGTRLHPLTRVTNKHLLPVYDRPMVFYPIQKRVEAGVRDILIVTGGNHAGEFLGLLGNGRPSRRNELEITDVNNRYIDWGELSHELLDGWWTDAGRSMAVDGG
jgi:glucose-1-phosphate thymidylyltransferase